MSSSNQKHILDMAADEHGSSVVASTPRDSEDLSQHFVGCSTQGNEFQEFFDQVLKIGIQFKSQTPVKKSVPPIPKTKSFESIPEHGMTYSQLLSCFKDMASNSTNIASPNFMGFPDSGNAAPALGAALLTPMLNQNQANHDILSPESTFVEMEVVHWLREQLGYSVPHTYNRASEIGGIITLGGCLSNTIALMAAREYVFPGSGMTGLPVPCSNIRVLVPDVIEHYSIRSSMAWLSMGEQNVIRVPVDDLFRMKLDKLEEVIKHERAEGHHILACVAYAGDSRSMRIDNLEAVGKVLKSANVWFHIDACHGSQLAFSRTHRHKVRGLRDADSVTIDPHKVLWIPYVCSVVMFKDPKSLANVRTNSDLILNTQWSLGQITPFIGSKSFEALKLWSVIKFFGRSGIERLIDARLELTRTVQQEILKHPDLLLLNDTDINSCMFVYMPAACHVKKVSGADLEKLNECNKFIKHAIVADGEFQIHGFPLKRCPHPLLPQEFSTYVIRTMNGNPLTQKADIDRLLNKVLSLGKQWFSARQYSMLNPGQTAADLPVMHDLRQKISSLFKGGEHVALVYGSSASTDNTIVSDIDIVVFVEDALFNESTKTKLESLVVNCFKQFNMRLDAEVPFDRKLLVPLSFIKQSHEMCGTYFKFDVPEIKKTPEYLRSDEMLHRLILNILTVPTYCVSGSATFMDFERMNCEYVLASTINRTHRKICKSPTEFVNAATRNGSRYGEEFLGYKDREDVQEYVKSLYEKTLKKPQVANTSVNPLGLSHRRHRSRKSLNHITETTKRMIMEGGSKTIGPCVILLNGFPAVGKLTTAMALQQNIESPTRLVDNHQWIDAACSIEPNRSAAQYRVLCNSFRDLLFGGLKTIPDNKTAIIMTNSLAMELREDALAFAEHVDIARARGVPFVVVSLTCNETINKVRLSERDVNRKTESMSGGELLNEKISLKTKLKSSDVLSSLLQQYTLLDPAAEILKSSLQGVEFRHLELDTSSFSVNESVNAVLEFLGKA